MLTWLVLLCFLYVVHSDLESCIEHIFTLYGNISTCVYHFETNYDLGYILKAPVSEGSCQLTDFVNLGPCSALKRVVREYDLVYKVQCWFQIGGVLRRPYVDYRSFKDNIGLDLCILRIIVDRLGLRPNFTCISCTESYSIDKRLFNSDPVDLDLVFFGLVFGWVGYFDMSYSFLQIEEAFFVPHPEPVEPWKHILHIYDWPTWLVVLLSILGFTVLSDFALIYVTSVLLLNTCSSKLPLRCFMLWQFASLLLTSSFSGLLTSFMCKSILQKPINSFEEIKDKGMQIGGILFWDLVQPIDYWKTCGLHELECYNKLRKGNYAYSSDSLVMGYLMSLHKNDSWHRLPPTHSYYYAYTLTRGSPFYDKFQESLILIEESGIPKTQSFYSWQRQPPKPAFSVVTMHHLYFIFIVYTVGIGLALSVFLLERSKGNLSLI